MYKNIYYQREKNLIHLWDSERGYLTFPYKRYAYKKAKHGEYESIYGDRLTKIYKFKRDDPGLFESDVAETTRVLVDLYTESDEPSDGHIILTYDIEVEMETGTPDPKEANNTITSIALHDNISDHYWVLVLDTEGILEKYTNEKQTVIPFSDERDLLKRYLDIYQEINPSIVTGWNCIPLDATVWLDDSIKPICNIETNDVLFDSTCSNVFPTTKKKVFDIKLNNGQILKSSKDHKFLVRYIPKGKYLNLKHKSKSYIEKYLTVDDIHNKMNDYDVFTEVIINNNNNRDLEHISDECLYVLGLIYTDGSISKKDKSVCIYNNDFNLMNQIKLYLDSQKKIIKDNNWHQKDIKTNYRLRTYLTEYNELSSYISFIWDDDNKVKSINTELLSKLSKRQFWIFMSGIIDGDGHIYSDLRRGIKIVNFNNDVYKLAELIRWNGSFCTMDNTSINIQLHNNNKWIKELLKLKIDYKHDNLQNHLIRELKNSKSNNVRWRYNEDTNSYWVKVISIENTNRVVDMIDIETTTHSFLYEGVRVHNCDYFDTPYLYNRIKRIMGESVANRLSPIGEVFFSPYRSRYFIAGVSYLDYLTLYKKFTYTELDNYRLDTIAFKELNRRKIEYTGNLDDLFRTDIDKFIEYNLVDVELVVGLNNKLQFIDLARGICHAGRVPYEDFVYSSKYLEGALLAYLKQRDLVAPNKPADREERMNDIRENKKEKFLGAYVKDPIVGKYSWVYDLDLTSLYPSIIMTLNISPETKVAKVSGWDAEEYLKGRGGDYSINGEALTRDNLQRMLDENDYSISSNGVLYRQDVVGCIPDILDLWFSRRVEFRKLESQYGKAGDEEKYAFYKKRQLVQKILLNSLYGVMGLPAWRWYDVDNAVAVTSTGQTVIKNTAKMGNIRYNKEIGGNPLILELEDDTKIEVYPDSLIKVKRDNEEIVIPAKDLEEGDDYIEKIGTVS